MLGEGTGYAKVNKHHLEFTLLPHLDLLPTPPQTNRKLEGRSIHSTGAQWSSVDSIIYLPMCHKLLFRDSPGSPVLKTPHFHSRGHRFGPWLGN